MGDNKSLLSTVITWTIIGVLAVVALKIVFGLIGFAAFLLFTVAPIVLIGWLAVKAWQAFTQPAA